jgi:hypothetical protein
MVSTLAMCLALIAQTPAQANSDSIECPPRLLKLKADRSGKVMIRVTESWKLKQIGVEGNRDGTGTPLMGVVPVEKTFEIGELKELVITRADGKKVDLHEARRRLADEATVIVSCNGKAVSPEFLKVFKDDTLVLVSPELIDQPCGDPHGIPLKRPNAR